MLQRVHRRPQIGSTHFSEADRAESLAPRERRARGLWQGRSFSCGLSALGRAVPRPPCGAPRPRAHWPNLRRIVANRSRSTTSSRSASILASESAALHRPAPRNRSRSGNQSHRTRAALGLRSSRPPRALDARGVHRVSPRNVGRQHLAVEHGLARRVHARRYTRAEQRPEPTEVDAVEPRRVRIVAAARDREPDQCDA